MSSKAGRRVLLKLSPDRKQSGKVMSSFISEESLGNFDHNLQNAQPLRKKLKDKSHSLMSIPVIEPLQATPIVAPEAEGPSIIDGFFGMINNLFKI